MEATSLKFFSNFALTIEFPAKKNLREGDKFLF